MPIKFTHTTWLTLKGGPADEPEDIEFRVALHCRGEPSAEADPWGDDPGSDADIELLSFEIFDEATRTWRKPNLDKNWPGNDCALAEAVADYVAGPNTLAVSLAGAMEPDPDMARERYQDRVA